MPEENKFQNCVHPFIHPSTHPSFLWSSLMKINMKFMLTCLHLYLTVVGWVILFRLPYLTMVGSEHSVIKMKFYHVVSALSLGDVCSTFSHQVPCNVTILLVFGVCWQQWKWWSVGVLCDSEIKMWLCHVIFVLSLGGVCDTLLKSFLCTWTVLLVFGVGWRQ